MDSYYVQQEQGSLIGGIFGAIIGAVVGAIPWAIAMYFGWIIGYFAFLISFGSFWGYTLLKGHRNAITIWLSVVVSTIVVIIFMNYISTVFSVMIQLKTNDFGYVFVGVGEYIKENPKDFLYNALFSLVFGVGGIYSAKNHINSYL